MDSLLRCQKNQKLHFLEIQIQNPHVRLIPPSVGRNARGGFNFGCIKRVLFDFFDTSLFIASKPYFYVPRSSSTILSVFPPLFGSSFLHISCWDKVQPIIKSFSLKICLGNKIFLQELFFRRKHGPLFFGVSANSSVIWNGKLDSDGLF